MRVRRVPIPCLVATATFAGSSIGLASPPYPRVVEEVLSLEQRPGCVVCHARPTGGPPADRPFALSLKERGVVGFNTQSRLRTALEELEVERVDSDEDGASDVYELRVDTDPNDAADVPSDPEPEPSEQEPEPDPEEPDGTDNGPPDEEQAAPVDGGAPTEAASSPTDAGTSDNDVNALDASSSGSGDIVDGESSENDASSGNDESTSEDDSNDGGSSNTASSGADDIEASVDGGGCSVQPAPRDRSRWWSALAVGFGVLLLGRRPRRSC